MLNLAYGKSRSSLFLLLALAASSAGAQDLQDGAMLALKIEWPASGPLSHAKSIRLHIRSLKGHGFDAYQMVVQRSKPSQILELPVLPGEYEIKSWAFDQPVGQGFLVARGEQEFTVAANQRLEITADVRQDLRRLSTIDVRPAHGSLLPGKKVQLIATAQDWLFRATPIFLPNEQVSWTLVAGKDIASLSDTGELTLNKKGSIIVEARVQDVRPIGRLCLNIGNTMEGAGIDEPFLIFADRLKAGLFSSPVTGIPEDPENWHVMASLKPIVEGPIALSRDGGKFYFQAYNFISDRHMLYEVTRTGQLRGLVEGRFESVAANEDGSELLLAGYSEHPTGGVSRLVALNVATKKAVTLLETPADDQSKTIRSVAWDGGNSIALICGDKFMLSTFDRNTRETKDLNRSAKAVSFHEDDSLLVLAADDKGSEFIVLDKSGTVLRTLHTDTSAVMGPIAVLGADTFVFQRLDDKNDFVPHIYRGGKVKRLSSKSDILVLGGYVPKIASKR